MRPILEKELKPLGPARHTSNRPSIWQALGLIALGVALCLVELYLGIVFLVFGLINLWLYFQPPRSAPNVHDWFPPELEVETTLTRLRRDPMPIPTRYRTGLIDSRCHYCQSGIAVSQPVWINTDEIGEERHMCGSCRDSLIVDRRRKG